MRRRSAFQPVVFCDPYAMAGQRKIAVELQSDGHVLCLEWAVGDYCIRKLTIEAVSLGTRYVPVEQPVAGQAASFKISALTHGATPEAIRLLGLICPLTKQEEAIMAEKLKSKGSVKAADKEGLKSAAKEAPVGKKPKAAPAAAKEEAAPAKKRGNPEALAKARAARASGADENRKYKVLVKIKDLTAREGSWTRAMLEHILGAKDTDSAKESLKGDRPNKDKKLDFTWAEKKGYIEF